MVDSSIDKVLGYCIKWNKLDKEYGFYVFIYMKKLIKDIFILLED